MDFHWTTEDEDHTESRWTKTARPKEQTASKDPETDGETESSDDKKEQPSSQVDGKEFEDEDSEDESLLESEAETLPRCKKLVARCRS